jgi:3-methyl-2-oxobutanoate hydroxymethyltransferase
MLRIYSRNPTFPKKALALLVVSIFSELTLANQPEYEAPPLDEIVVSASGYEQKILEDAFAIQDAGCFMLEFEAVPAKIATVISQQLEIPTIGIGAGVGTDGQILLCHDLLGVFSDFKPKFTKRYANLTEVAVEGIKKYIAEVKSSAFPDDDHSYSVDEKEYEKFLNLVEKRKHQ